MRLFVSRHSRPVGWLSLLVIHDPVYILLSILSSLQYKSLSLEIKSSVQCKLLEFSRAVPSRPYEECLLFVGWTRAVRRVFWRHCQSTTIPPHSQCGERLEFQAKNSWAWYSRYCCRDPVEGDEPSGGLEVYVNVSGLAKTCYRTHQNVIAVCGFAGLISPTLYWLGPMVRSLGWIRNKCTYHSCGWINTFQSTPGPQFTADLSVTGGRCLVWL